MGYDIHGIGEYPGGYVHRRSGHKIYKAKQQQRTEIQPEQWADSRYAYSDVLERLSDIQYSEQRIPIPRIHRRDLTVERFYEQYLIPGKPVIIEGCMDDWPAMKKWDVESLEKRFRHVNVKVGESDDGRRIRIKTKYFMDYMKLQVDDSPLYMFESALEENAHWKTLSQDYKIPDLFPFDFFNTLGPEHKPPYHWFCVGPKRSGTTMHKDPLGTSAWNAVTHGVKRWLIVVDGNPSRSTIKGKDVMRRGEDDEAIHYYDFILPRILEKNPGLKVMDGLQKAGDVIYVPGEMWHAVLNLEDTVAVTHNYVGLDNFDLCWIKTRKDRKKLALRWLRSLARNCPELYARCLELNVRDGFVMSNCDSDSDSSDSSSSSSGSTSDDEAINFTGVHMPPGLNLLPPWKMGLHPRTLKRVRDPAVAPDENMGAQSLQHRVNDDCA